MYDYRKRDSSTENKHNVMIEVVMTTQGVKKFLYFFHIYQLLFSIYIISNFLIF